MNNYCVLNQANLLRQSKTALKDPNSLLLPINNLIKFIKFSYENNLEINNCFALIKGEKYKVSAFVELEKHSVQISFSDNDDIHVRYSKGATWDEKNENSTFKEYNTEDSKEIIESIKSHLTDCYFSKNDIVKNIDNFIKTKDYELSDELIMELKGWIDSIFKIDNRKFEIGLLLVKTAIQLLLENKNRYVEIVFFDDKIGIAAYTIKWNEKEGKNDYNYFKTHTLNLKEKAKKNHLSSVLNWINSF